MLIDNASFRAKSAALSITGSSNVSSSENYFAAVLETGQGHDMYFIGDSQYHLFAAAGFSVRADITVKWSRVL